MQSWDFFFFLILIPRCKMTDTDAWTYFGGSVSMSLISLETVMV